MALPGILQKPIKAYHDHQYKQKVQAKALTSPESLVLTLKFLKPGSDLSLQGRRLSSGKRNWVDKYLHPHGGKAGAAKGLRTFADLQKRHNTHPVAQQAAKDLAERLPQEKSDNKVVKYDNELYKLAHRIAYPTQYEHELKNETPTPTVVPTEAIVSQEPATTCLDADDLGLIDAINETLPVLDARTAWAIQKTKSEVSDSLMDGGFLHFAPTLLRNLPDPPKRAADQDTSELDKLNHYLDNTALLNQVGEGDRHALTEYRSELLKAEEKKQQAV
ncbi:MAG: hypothetical protein GTN84_18110 [Hydrogenophaga sp.]|uniref:hypothetical protein n=1 Tax=Hydrogenophaga sp. TaxID=1904254 RepID=UPI001698D677|nr:hypothetical protein [Hydrogenophaga sp.]NIM43158.1 hypothetical protein [Hydrogenophaga sp.]NIN28226.1 hypothetical protein [Hydrogenophaga sp.]NIN30664.1 hypothetical protein [Hydrogenophaga sp.]NIN57361.1 hypothetical protein [Hydrogenophaga sp.]NIO51580.1 hypothetical protein [Hydrogenophaga sp.]